MYLQAFKNHLKDIEAKHLRAESFDEMSQISTMVFDRA